MRTSQVQVLQRLPSTPCCSSWWSMGRSGMQPQSAVPACVDACVFFVAPAAARADAAGAARACMERDGRAWGARSSRRWPLGSAGCGLLRGGASGGPAVIMPRVLSLHRGHHGPHGSRLNGEWNENRKPPSQRGGLCLTLPTGPPPHPMCAVAARWRARLPPTPPAKEFSQGPLSCHPTPSLAVALPCAMPTTPAAVAWAPATLNDLPTPPSSSSPSPISPSPIIGGWRTAP